MMKRFMLGVALCLAVGAQATTAQYFRFTPTAYIGVDAFDWNFGFSELELLDANGDVIPWSGATATSETAVGGDQGLPETCDNKHDQVIRFQTSAIKYPWLQIDAGRPVEFAAYAWWTLGYSAGYRDRVPTGWKFEISDDGQSWTVFDERAGCPGFELKVDGKSEHRGPFAPSVDMTIGKDEVYRIEDGDPILSGGGGKFKIFGTLDLNGHSVTIGHIGNQPENPDVYLSDDLICDLSSAKIVNGSSTEATLTVNSMNFAGAITETVGKINLTLKQGASILVGYPKSLAPSTIRLEGTAELLPYSIYDVFCFRFKKNRAGNAAPIAVAEVQMTYGGKAIPETLRSYIGSSASTSADEDHSYPLVMDGNTYTDWVSKDDDPDVRLRVVTSDMKAPVDGYRIAAPADSAFAPTDWEVYVYRRFAWFKADERHGVALGGPDGSYVQGRLSPDYRFEYAYRPSSQFGDHTQIVQEGSELRILADVLSFDKLSGSGNLRFESGASLICPDSSDWTGAFLQGDTQSRDLMGHLLIDATRGGTMQNARIKNPNHANISIENATTTPVSLLIDDSWPNSEAQPQYGRVADGRGPMGIVKRDVVKRVLETQDSVYTGDTRIEEGTLEVRGPRTISYAGPLSARYFRFTPTKYKSVDSFDYNLGICEIQLLDEDGGVLAWPDGTEVSCNSTSHSGYDPVDCTIDGKLDQKCIIVTGDITYPSITIDARSYVNFHGYRWYTNRYEPASDSARLPTGWKFEVSADGKTWQVYDEQPNGPDWDTSAQQSKSQLRGPYKKDVVEEEVATPGDMLAPSPLKPFFADTTDRTSHAPALKSRYFILSVTQVLGSNRDANVHGFELADFELYYHGLPVAWPESVNVTGGGVREVSGKMANLLDNDATTAYSVEDEMVVFKVDAGKELTFDAYAFRSSTAANGVCYQRLPTAWNLKVSTNRSEWVILDNAGNMDAELKSEPGALQGPWNVGNLQPLLSEGPNDSLSDVSKVVISEGATLQINAAYEKMGPLTGTGALNLYFGAAVHANAVTAATFGGSVTGVGTFVGGGAGGQTLTGAHSFIGKLEATEGALILDEAEFPNVTMLELSANGVLSGVGSFGGNLSVSFDGGAMDSALTVAGTLDVNGDDVVRFKVPDDIAQAGANWSFTPFTAGVISASAKAKLAAARAVVPEGAPKYRLRVTCTDTACMVEAYRPGQMIILR